MTRARDVANLIGSGNYSSTTFTATAGQTVFSIAHTQNFVQVFMNGLLLDLTVDYTSNGSAVTLTSGAAAGDEIEVVAYNTFSVGDALNQAAADTRYVNTAGDTMTGNLQSTELVANNAGNNTNIRVQNTASGSGSSDGFVIQNATNSKVYLWNYENSDVLFGTNSIERLKIDSAGRVTMPSQPAFKAFSTPYGWTSFGSTNNTLMPFNAVQHNVGNHYSTSNYRFTAPVAGVYYFYGQWYSDGNTFGELLIRQNGSAEKAFARNNSQSVTVQCATTLSLSANDYIEMFGKISNSDGSDWYSYNSYSYFCGYLIG
ncbi:MAG: hypothetical protein CL832_10915 [Crocinitomicaceae bacterium]|nr:hypothetical protein [Crocinitomicaceae bacterium]